MTKTDWQERLVKITEGVLTFRKRRKLRQQEKQKRKHPVYDWVEAFLSAVIIVFFINQYLFQAYQIPSGSMLETLQLQDRIFVDKLTFGPELLPGVIKFPGFREPKRGDIIIFENPEYISGGPAMDVLIRIVYMMTFSFVDLDRDEQGNPKVHFLIKRMIGQGDERLLETEAGLKIMPSGETRYIDEMTLQELEGTGYELNRRLISADLYPVLERAASALTYLEQGYPLSDLDPLLIIALDTCFQVASYDPLLEKNGYQLAGMSKEELDQVSEIFKNRFPASFNDRGYARKPFTAGNIAFVTRATDPNFFIKYKALNRGEMSPQNYSLRKEFYQKYLGRYIPEANLLPLGDNRDNSKDGRYFGPVAVNKILGKPLLRFWPLDRFGGVE